MTNTMTGAEPAAATTKARELGHIVLYVRDLARSVAFYGDILEWPQVMGGGLGFPVAAFSGGRTHHELLLIEVGPQAAPIPPGRRVGMYHFGVKVGDNDDDLRSILARVKANPDLVTLVGATDHHVTHSLYVHDPDGNEVELYVDVPGVDWRNDPTALARPPEPLAL